MLFMRRTIINIILAVFWAIACGPSFESRYPSYQHTIAKYAPPAEYEGVKLVDPNTFPSSRYCDCPRVWYHDHWVYYYRGHWIYWDYGLWHYYPGFHVYFYGGHPYVYQRSGRAVTTHPPHDRNDRRIKRAPPRERKQKTRRIAKPPLRSPGIKARPQHAQPQRKKR